MDELEQWLSLVGLQGLAAVLRGNDIGLDILPDLTETDLERLGLSLGNRKRLLKTAATLRPPAPTPGGEHAASPFGRGSTSAAERRHLTVMFCDLVGSTALASRLDPEELRAVFAAYHRCIADTVAGFGGFVAKYMGDGALVYFGYPQAHEEDAERAVRAGLSLAERVGRLATPERLQVRVGIGTGLVVVGSQVGSGDAHECGVVGRAPNLAARLQALAAPNTVVIDTETHLLIGALFDCRDLGSVAVKGFATPIHPFEVLRPSAIESRFEAFHPTSLAPLVGRAADIAQLAALWQPAKNGHGQVALIAGEAGIGKSRLAAAVQDMVAGEPHTRLRQFCSPYHAESPLHPVIAQLARAAGFERDDPPTVKLSKLEALLAPAHPTLADVALIAELLSLPATGRYPALNWTPQRKKEKTFTALLHQFECLAAAHPLLMIYEDVHWIDPTSRELLDRTIDKVQHLPVLLIVTFRPDFQPPWIGQRHVALLRLNRLDEREGATLVQQVLGHRALPGEAIDTIVARSDGVPLFIEELTKAVLEACIGGEPSGDVGPPRPAFHTSAFPTTLHASLIARLDRLGPAAKEVAQVGAVIGREFSYDMLASAIGWSDAALQDALDRLTEAELLFGRGEPPDARFLFKHALVQDAACRTLLHGRRQDLHGAIAQALIERFPEQAEVEPEVVAHHLTEAGQAERAAAYWLKAGCRAAQRSADWEAVRQLNRGLEVLMARPASIERDRMELEFQLALGTPLISISGWTGPQVARAYERAKGLCEQLGDTDRLIPTLFGLASNRVVRGETLVALRLAKQCRALALRAGLPAPLLLSHRATGAALMQAGAFAHARREFEAIPALYDPERDRELAARSVTDPRASGLAFLSLVLWALGYPDQAKGTAAEALRCAVELEHANTVNHVRFYAGAQLSELLRDVHAAREHADAAIAWADRHRLASWRGHSSIIRGWVCAQEGQLREGIALMERGIADLAAIGTAFHRPHYLALLATLHAERGDSAAGLRTIQEAMDWAKRSGERVWKADLHRIEGDLLRLAGAPMPAVERCFTDALAVARRQRAKSFELRAATRLAGCWRERGKREDARALLAPVRAWFADGCWTPDVQDAQAMLETLT